MKPTSRPATWTVSFDEGQWQDAVRLFAKIERKHPGYRDSARLLAVAWQHVPQQNLKAGQSVLSLAFSPDGTRLATASTDKTARVWDLTTGAELLRVQHMDWVNSVAFSSDGTRLATGSWDNMARVWDAATSVELLRVQHTDGVASVAFSPGRDRLATGSSDKTVQVTSLP